MIQLYAHVNDLIQSESLEHNRKERLIDESTSSILENGIWDCLNIKPDGYILRGNLRLSLAAQLNLDYLPINLASFLGIYVNSDGVHIRIRKSIVDYYIENRPETNDHTIYKACVPADPIFPSGRTDIGYPMKTEDDYYFYKLEHKAEIRHDEQNNDNRSQSPLQHNQRMERGN